jgi:hypothetical protein
VIVMLFATLLARTSPRAMAATGCAAATNPVVCENALPGAPRSQWDAGSGDPSIFDVEAVLAYARKMIRDPLAHLSALD